jgi:hypothetical protein
LGKIIMKMLVKLAASAAIAAATLMPSAAFAQPAPRALVSIYHAATGHQEALMKWLADQDRVAAKVGVAPGQVYVHTDGDSWDFMVIYPVTTDAQDAQFDVAAKKMGVTTGPRAGLEFRKHIQSHTDTFTRGPMTAAQYLSSLGPDR